jgi:hypothetical protein
MQVELLKSHTHAGVARQPGAVIALDDDRAQWLLDTGVARVVSSPAATKLAPLPHRKSNSPIEEKSL